MANSAAFLFHMAAASSTHVEGDECMEDIRTRTEILDISNPVEERPVRENLGDNNESQQYDEVHDETAQPENTRNTDVEADEGMEDIQADTEEFRPADPQGEEPVRWDFDHVDESRAGIEIHVEFNHGKWWHVPYYLSDPILAEWMNGNQQVSFVWDWENSRKGSFVLGGVATSIDRYIMDFNKMQQTNIDNNRTRRIKVVSVIRGSM